MPEEHKPDQEVLRGALGPGKNCPRVEELERLIERSAGGSAPEALSEHVQGCAYCRTELRLLETFLSAEAGEEDAAAVRFVEKRLRERSAEIFARGREAAPAQRGSWWASLMALPWLRPAMLAAGALLVAVAIGIPWRLTGPPALSPAGGSEVMRSRTMELVAPRGDLQEAPREIQWQAVAGAAKYSVRLLEVDRTELWKMETAQTRVEIPPQVQGRIVPAKTLLCEVGAYDAAGRKVAESETVRFRVLQKVYSH